MRLRIAKYDGRPPLVKSAYTAVDDHTIIGSDSWISENGIRGERHQVLTIRDGKIVNIQSFKTRRDAEAFAVRLPS